MNKETCRVVQTGTKADAKVLDMYRAVFGQMSDGIWENSSHMRGYWEYAIPAVDADNNVIIYIDDTPCHWEYNSWTHRTSKVLNKWYDMSDIEVVDYLVKKIAYIYKLERKHNAEKISTDVSQYLNYSSGVTFDDAERYVTHMKNIIREAKKAIA